MRKIRLRHSKDECEESNDGSGSIHFICALVLALVMSLLVILIVQIVAAKYSRTKFLNKLTLIPFYFCILFLMMLMFQVTLISYCQRFVEQTWYGILYDNVPMAKAIMFCISVLVQLLEWNCLIFMMRF